MQQDIEYTPPKKIQKPDEDYYTDYTQFNQQEKKIQFQQEKPSKISNIPLKKDKKNFTKGFQFLKKNESPQVVWERIRQNNYPKSKREQYTKGWMTEPRQNKFEFQYKPTEDVNLPIFNNPSKFYEENDSNNNNNLHKKALQNNLFGNNNQNSHDNIFKQTNFFATPQKSSFGTPLKQQKQIEKTPTSSAKKLNFSLFQNSPYVNHDSKKFQNNYSNQEMFFQSPPRKSTFDYTNNDENNNYLMSTPPKKNKQIFENEERTPPKKLSSVQKYHEILQESVQKTYQASKFSKDLDQEDEGDYHNNNNFTPQKRKPGLFDSFSSNSSQNNKKFKSKINPDLSQNSNGYLQQSAWKQQRSGTFSDIDEEDNYQKKEKKKIANYSEDYIFEKEIGHGSFGSVWKCQSKIDNKYYAVKISKKQIMGAGSKKEVLNEVLAMAKFTAMDNSENIVGHKNAWIQEGQLYHAMELCKESLTQRQKDMVIFSEEDIKKIIREVSKSLKLLHKHNQSHLDIKPDNILISLKDTYKIADLGLSRVKTLKRGEYYREGDSRYLAKELLNPPKEGQILDLGKCDIFSLGVSLYELMTRKQLEGNGEEWHQIRKGILDWEEEEEMDDKTPKKENNESSMEDRSTPASKIGDEIEEEEYQQEPIAETFEQQMKRIAEENRKEEEQRLKQQQQSNKIPLKPGQKPVKYTQQLKNLVLKMVLTDPQERPSAEQILRDPYLKKDRTKLLLFEKKLQAALQANINKVTQEIKMIQKKSKEI